MRLLLLQDLHSWTPGASTLLAGRDSWGGVCHAVTCSYARPAPFPGSHSPTPSSLGTRLFRHTLSLLTQSHLTTRLQALHPIRRSLSQSLTQSNFHIPNYTHDTPISLKLTHAYTLTPAHIHTHTCSNHFPQLLPTHATHIHILKHFDRLNCTLKIHVHPESDVEINSSQI